MQVAVTNTGRQNLQKHLAAGRLGVDPLGELHRLAATADLETAHFRFSPALFYGRRTSRSHGQGTINAVARHDDLIRNCKMPKNWSPPPPMRGLANIFAESG